MHGCVATTPSHFISSHNDIIYNKDTILTLYMYNAWLFMQLFQPFGFLMDIATFHACKCISFCVVIAAYVVCM